MKAIVQERYGPAEVLDLRELDTPALADNEVLVRVRAAGLNVADPHIMRGSPPMLRLVYGLFRPRTKVRGTDVAGVVEAAGANVTAFQPGDEVFGWCKEAFAEFVHTEDSHLVHKPDRIGFEQAAAVGVAAFTALQAIRDKGAVRPGHKVLINGASGGVGTFAVQIAKAYGAEVTGVCSTTNLELVRDLGADHVIDYTKEDFTDRPERYDLILDNVGNHSLARLTNRLVPKGTLIPNSGRTIRPLLMSLSVSQKIRPFLSLPTTEDLAELKDLIEAGKLTPVVDRTYPLAEVPDAIRYLEEGHAKGKVVATM